MSRVSQRTNDAMKVLALATVAAPARLPHRRPARHECGRAALQGRPVELLDRRRRDRGPRPARARRRVAEPLDPPASSSSRRSSDVIAPPGLRRVASNSGQSAHDEHRHDTLRPGREQPHPDRSRRPLPGEHGLQPRVSPGSTATWRSSCASRTCAGSPCSTWRAAPMGSPDGRSTTSRCSRRIPTTRRRSGAARTRD